MKKLLTIALLTLSPFTFAKDFKPDLLVGMWQCKTTFNYPEVNLRGIETSTIKFEKYNIYHQKAIMDSISDGQKNIVKTQVSGKWKITGDIFSFNIEDLIDYYASNQQLEAYYQVEQDLREDKSFTNFKILELSKNKIVLTSTGKEAFEKNADYQEICHRIK